MAVASCGDSAPSSSPGDPGPGPRVTADATVGGDIDAAGAVDASVQPRVGPVVVPPPDAGLSTGPDGAAPIACDADAASGIQCTVPPNDCVDGGGVWYSGGWCVGGTCQWQPIAIRCVGGDVGTRCAPPGSPGLNGSVVVDDAGTWAVENGCLIPVSGAPGPPQVPCTAGGSGDAGECPPPRSVCANGGWLIYYDEGACTGGRCAWRELYLYCGNGCSQGACGSPGTVPPGP